ncbi:DUF4336 domain-containing protein [Methyloligella sp. 2.7D]|uniref:DUF4336 domain-containing protein n=1 Tax=unclassified Methyloligella TaxID=2625955 RepID=UPI00157D8C96|nr:DUF4336 domain-containing protein [Methyloligella sp. GL2]QKP76179.1 DUF4336 domain-containing protein [Methyloligella sp. GL2]
MDAIYQGYAPLNVPKPVADDIWIVDGPEIKFNYLGLHMPFPTRMTAIRLKDGSLWLHSPIALDEDLIAALEALGPIRFLIAPNTLHYWYVPEWKARFPEAAVYGAPGLARAAKRPLALDHILGGEAPEAWAGEIDQVLVPGNLLTEVDFFHRASSTLILTDLIENFELDRMHSRFYKLAMRWAGTADPDGRTPIDMQFSFLGYRDKVRKAVQQMIAWAPERIILAHGRWYEKDGVAELKRAFRWVL